MSALPAYTVPVWCSWCDKPKLDDDGRPKFTESVMNGRSDGICNPCSQRVMAAAKAHRASLRRSK